ncbi:MAG: sigma-70 family RNA polymerase sigma factor [Myxococcota bacterium]
MTRPDPESAFDVQSQVRAPWRRYLDSLAPLRPDLHRYCVRLTGNVWDGEDLVQDALMRVFSMMGRLDADLENPRAYLLRTATHLWIDRMRRRERERSLLAGGSAEPPQTGRDDPSRTAEVRDAAGALLGALPPRERAALLLKDVFDLSLEETAALLQTTVGAVKAALHRGRGRLEASDPSDATVLPDRAVVERFMKALASRDLDALESICSADLAVELVGGAQSDTFEQSRSFFAHAHMVLPKLGFGENPHWKLAEYRGEPIVLGFRTLDGVEGLNEIHRIEEVDGCIQRVRCYCFSPDVLATVAAELGLTALRRPYRSPG